MEHETDGTIPEWYQPDLEGLIQSVKLAQNFHPNPENELGLISKLDPRTFELYGIIRQSHISRGNLTCVLDIVSNKIPALHFESKEIVSNDGIGIIVESISFDFYYRP